MRSIRGKIGLAYGALALLGLVFMVFAYADLRYLEARMDDGVDVSAFREDTLEMRRHEKNYLLYQEPRDLLAAMELAESTQRLLGNRWPLLDNLLGSPGRDVLRDALNRYRELMARQWDKLGESPRMPEAQAEAVRSLGHQISEQAERLARREREALLASMRQAMLALIGFAAGVVVLGVLAGQVLSHMVARPLRELEEELLPLAEGRFSRFTAPSRDREFVSLTQALNRMLAELDARRRQVLQAEKLSSMGVLASGVAHELNNPLGNISAAAQILAEEMDVTDERHAWVEQIDAEAERGRRIVRTLLDYARRQDFRPDRVALEEVLDKSLILLGKRRPAPDRLRLDLQPDLAVWVDEQRMQQVFINLLRNALDAGATHVTIFARRSRWGETRPPTDASLAGAVADMHDDSAVTVIQVRDDGPGIPREALPHVFDPFFTTRGAGHGEGHGVGLGLFVVEEIVSEHGGCVAAENLPEGGARFTLWLPCRMGEEAHA